MSPALHVDGVRIATFSRRAPERPSPARRHKASRRSSLPWLWIADLRPGSVKRIGRIRASLPRPAADTGGEGVPPSPPDRSRDRKGCQETPFLFREDEIRNRRRRRRRSRLPSKAGKNGPKPSPPGTPKWSSTTPGISGKSGPTRGARNEEGHRGARSAPRRRWHRTAEPVSPAASPVSDTRGCWGTDMRRSAPVLRSAIGGLHRTPTDGGASVRLPVRMRPVLVDEGLPGQCSGCRRPGPPGSMASTSRSAIE